MQKTWGPPRKKGESSAALGPMAYISPRPRAASTSDVDERSDNRVTAKSPKHFAQAN